MLENLRLVPDSVSKEKGNEEEGEEDSEDEDEEDEIKDAKKSKKPQTEEAFERPKIPKLREDVFMQSEAAIPLLPPLNEETKLDAESIKGKYKQTAGETWIETFMKNNKYGIIDNEGGGDCLFATIRDAFAQLGQQTTVQKLRKKLAAEADEKLFLNYKEHYDMYTVAVIGATKDAKELEIEYEKYKKLYSETLDRTEKKHFIESAKKIKAQRDRVLNEKKVSQDILKNSGKRFKRASFGLKRGL